MEKEFLILPFLKSFEECIKNKIEEDRIYFLSITNKKLFYFDKDFKEKYISIPPEIFNKIKDENIAFKELFEKKVINAFSVNGIHFLPKKTDSSLKSFILRKGEFLSPTQPYLMVNYNLILY